MRAVAGSWLALVFAAGRLMAAPGLPVPAVWREHHVSFDYMGRTSRYSCDGLSDKVRAMLIDLGARRDLHISAIGCPQFGRPGGGDSLNPRLSVVFAAPALPGVTGTPSQAGKLAPVQARFEPFTIAPDAFRDMSVGDCELVEEFAQQILPLFTIRGVKKDITCVPYQLSGSSYFLRGEILRALPGG
ncbi:MAG: hypothetical protein HKM03_12190 [Steroidobacteraceae bacterium]|nr:hypothetical protein [Steroidobacteraceae bacterium]